MRWFNDPVTLLAVSAGASAAGSLAEGNAAQLNAENQASFLRSEASAVELQRGRDLRDEKEQNRLDTARLSAVLAARGVELTSGTALSLIGQSVSESARRQTRLKQDTGIRQQSLLAKAVNVQKSGKLAKQRSRIKAIGQVAAGGAKISSLG